MATRPVYNTGKGFFTLNGKIYDANGIEFKIKGVNCCHYEHFWMTWDPPYHGLYNIKINAIRIVTPLWAEITEETLDNLIQKQINNRMVPIPGIWYTENTWNEEYNITGQSGLEIFNTALNLWVSRARFFKKYERYMILNIANEWGSYNTDWRDTYIDAVQTLRDAGYLCTIMIDAPANGQNPHGLIDYAQAVYDADPQKNIIFSIHIYGYWYVGTPSWEEYELYTHLTDLKNTGLPIIVGEFGPGNMEQPVSWDPLTFECIELITATEAEGLNGWLAWAWDDGIYSTSRWAMTEDSNFILASDGSPSNGSYPDNTDLSPFGNIVVLHPDFGTFYHPYPTATIFGEGLIF